MNMGEDSGQVHRYEEWTCTPVRRSTDDGLDVRCLKE